MADDAPGARTPLSCLGERESRPAKLWHERSKLDFLRDFQLRHVLKGYLVKLEHEITELEIKHL
jgi:hypothetical protein